MSRAWVQDGKIREVAPAGDLSQVFAPEVAKNFSVDVPDDAQAGDRWDGEKLTKRVPDEPVAVEPQPEPVKEYTLVFQENELHLFTLCSGLVEMARKG